MMYVRTDKYPATLPPSPCVGNLSGQDRRPRMLCDSSCPQFTDRKKPGRCTLQAIDVAPGEECSMLRRFISGTEYHAED